MGRLPQFYETTKHALEPSVFNLLKLSCNRMGFGVMRFDSVGQWVLR
jgi:hypothetical protein